MLKVIKIDGTQLSNKPSLLSAIDSNGFTFITDDGEEEMLTFETIKEYFLNKTVKIKIEEISRSIVE